MALDSPEIVTAVTVPTLRAWQEWLTGSVDAALALCDGAMSWMDDHRIGPHHLAFDCLITTGWCRLSAGDIESAHQLSRRATADAERLGAPWNQLQAGYLAARLELVLGRPLAAGQIVEDLRAAISLDACPGYVERLEGLEILALHAAGRRTDVDRRIRALQPGPRAWLLSAQCQPQSDRTLERLLRDRHGWPMTERVQAELLLATRSDDGASNAALATLVAEAASGGWVLPFLGSGPRVERLLWSLPLAELHPRLAAALAPPAPTPRPARGPQPASPERLTPRELSFVEYLPTHLSYAEIGDRLFLSLNTVKSNLKALYRKLGATSRADAVDACRQRGLL